MESRRYLHTQHTSAGSILWLGSAILATRDLDESLRKERDTESRVDRYQTIKFRDLPVGGWKFSRFLGVVRD
jgi:hypothetical protein